MNINVRELLVLVLIKSVKCKFMMATCIIIDQCLQVDYKDKSTIGAGSIHTLCSKDISRLNFTHGMNVMGVTH